MDISESLYIIIQKLTLIENDILKINMEIKEIRTGVNKMEAHISFVDSVYNKIKSPFHYILNYVDKNIISDNLEQLT